ncbi:SAV_2336 family protein [Kitasatospora sp. NBC_00085]|uniref:SAV_2336 N-terminal domain-related protein n=1 Tax=unclassified Kitasatospora TaxID=2633591 RepID=UPI00324654D4
MGDRVVGLVAALSRILPPDTDAATVADALWLAANSGEDTTDGGEPASMPSPSAAAGLPEGTRPSTAAPSPDTLPNPAPEAVPGVPLYENLPAGPSAPGRPVRVAAGRALPHALELGRALRPFKRRHPRGVRRALDLEATVREYARGGELAPVLGPAPEPWFEVVVLVDTHPTMEVWRETIEEFTTLLAGIGAFRRVRSLRLTVDGEPPITDDRGRAVPRGRVTAPGGRRLILVLSDCAAPGWRRPESWQLLRSWGAGTPVVLLNPLPSRLWSATGLDLPTVRVQNRKPSAHNTELSYDVPLMVSALFGTDPGWMPLPTLALTPHSLHRWANGVMRGAPAGYDAVLVPASGVLDSPFADHAEPAPDAARRTAAFLHTASPAARQLAALCSPFTRLSLPLLQLVRQTAVPEATVGDVAELLTSGLLDIQVVENAPAILTFHEAARTRLSRLVTRHDAWTVQTALTRHIASHRPQAGRGLAAVAVEDPALLPPDVQPFAVASDELLAVLDGGRREARADTPEPALSHEEPTEAESAGPEFPDPARSAALLIGVSGYRALQSPPGVEQALEDMRSVLTSSNSWNLSTDRCQTLLDPSSPEMVLDALRAACDRADDTVLVYFAGHGVTSGARGTDTLLALDDTAGLLLSRLSAVLARKPPDRVVLLMDLCGSSRAGAHLGYGSPESDFYALSTHDVNATEHSLLLADHLFGLLQMGLPGAPELLDFPTVAAGVHRDAASGMRDGSGASRRPLAMLRNRRAPGYVEPHLRDVFAQVCHAVRGQLVARYPVRFYNEIHRILLALITLASNHVITLTEKRPSAMVERSVEDFLARNLEPELVVRRAESDVTTLYVQEADGDFRMPVDVRTVSLRGLGPVDAIMISSVREPLRVTVVLDRSDGIRDSELFDISPDVGVTTVHGAGRTSEVVVLRIPVHGPVAPRARTLDEALREAVVSACEDLHGDVIELGLEPDVPELSGASDATIEHLEPDLLTVEWHLVEAFESGLTLGEVRVDADIVLSSFVTPVEAPEWTDEHPAELSARIRAGLIFHAQVDGPDFQVTLEYAGMEV